MFLLFTIIYPQIKMNVVKKISAWQNPRQLASAKVNFEGLLAIIFVFHSFSASCKKEKSSVDKFRKNKDGSYVFYWCFCLAFFKH